MVPINWTVRARRGLTHPVTPGIVIAGAALVVLAAQITLGGPGALAWAIFAVAAGYAISGSV